MSDLIHGIALALVFLVGFAAGVAFASPRRWLVEEERNRWRQAGDVRRSGGPRVLRGRAIRWEVPR